MNKCQCPICQSNMVSFTDTYIVCHNCGHREYLYDYRNAYDNPMPRPTEPDITELEDRVGNLEAISAQGGRIPRHYFDQFQQIRGELAHLHNKIAGQPAKAREPVKSTYKGLAVE